MHGNPTVYGTATVGAKGQIVIPSEAREALGLEPGDKVLVLGAKKGFLGICPLNEMHTFLEAQKQHLEKLQNIVSDEKEKSDK